MAKSIKNLKRLRQINLNRNKITENGAKQLIDISLYNKSIETLNLCNNRIKDSILIYLENLKTLKNESLREIFLNGNFINETKFSQPQELFR